MQNQTKEKYITLKEAAEISGYAPDYIGQLIRKGKLPGKQVYCTVAWMTTEEAVRKYLEKNENKKETVLGTDFCHFLKVPNVCTHYQTLLTLKEKFLEQIQQVKNMVLLELKFAKFFKTILYLTIILSIGFTLLLFYIFSISVENKLHQKAVEKLEKEMQIQKSS